MRCARKKTYWRTQLVPGNGEKQQEQRTHQRYKKKLFAGMKKINLCVYYIFCKLWHGTKKSRPATLPKSEQLVQNTEKNTSQNHVK